MHRILLIFTILLSTLYGEINVFPGSIGVEVIGFDLTKPLSPEQLDQIKSLLAERLVVVIRNQNLSAKQQVQFTKQLGDPEIAWDKPSRHPDEPRAHVINNDAIQKNPDYKSSTFYWHWDKSFLDYPIHISIAHLKSSPPPEGYGKTIFSNLTLAYEELDSETKQQLEDLQVVHSYAHMTGMRRKNYEKVHLNFKVGAGQFADVLHPLVKVHPITQKKSLNLDELFQTGIIGMSPQESKILHKQLFAHATQDHLIYEHTWKEGDIVLWDNLALMHKATPSHPDSYRELRRTDVSSRPLYEGRAIIIGAEELPPNFRYDKLFARPLVLPSDVDNDLDLLYRRLVSLRNGDPIDNLAPHALILVVGKRWKESPYIWNLIDFVADRHDTIEDYCLSHYLKQDRHERKISGELSYNHLRRKIKLLVSSWETYFRDDTPSVIRQQREQVHAKILATAFAHTDLQKSEQEWLCYAQDKKELPHSKNKPTLLFLGGGQGSGRTTMVRDLSNCGLIDRNTVVINTKLFFDHLQGNIPYRHKVKLWPIIHEEKKHLVNKIAKIAIAHDLNVVIDTYLLENSHCKELIESVKSLGAHTTMITLSTPLHEAYRRGREAAKDKEEYCGHVYEILMFHKLFAQSWPYFQSLFDTTLVVDSKPGINHLVFMSQDGELELFDPQKMSNFLAESYIDPDELADRICMTQAPVELLQSEIETSLSLPQIAQTLQSVSSNSILKSSIE